MIYCHYNWVSLFVSPHRSCLTPTRFRKGETHLRQSTAHCLSWESAPSILTQPPAPTTMGLKQSSAAFILDLCVLDYNYAGEHKFQVYNLQLSFLKSFSPEQRCYQKGRCRILNKRLNYNIQRIRLYIVSCSKEGEHFLSKPITTRPGPQKSV